MTAGKDAGDREVVSTITLGSIPTNAELDQIKRQFEVEGYNGVKLMRVVNWGGEIQYDVTALTGSNPYDKPTVQTIPYFKWNVHRLPDGSEEYTHRQCPECGEWINCVNQRRFNKFEAVIRTAREIDPDNYTSEDVERFSDAIDEFNDASYANNADGEHWLNQHAK